MAELVDLFRRFGFRQGVIEFLTGFAAERLQVGTLRPGHDLVPCRPIVGIFLGIERSGRRISWRNFIGIHQEKNRDRTAARTCQCEDHACDRLRFRSMDKLGDAINRQDWLEPVEQVLGKVADTLFLKGVPGGAKLRNFFHGTWLGHPLHPVITDVPIGAWSAAVVLDAYELVTGDDRLAPGADMAVSVGLVGAAGAALSGLNDWNYTSGKPKRVGALHAITNIVATACYLGSWWQRRNGCRTAGITSAFAGYAISAVGAYLGGHLVYNERMGVNHAPEELPEKFVPVMKESDLPDDKMVKADADGVPVLVVKTQRPHFRDGREVLASRRSARGRRVRWRDRDLPVARVAIPD